jgi:DegV family protein with EDD domain
MVRIVTDSSADIPPEIAAELGITVVPLYIRFGDRTYRDGVDITADEFYEKLARAHWLPATSVPSPGDLARIYQELAAGGEDIVSIHLSPRYSGALNVATLAREYVTGPSRILTVDSHSVSMGCGLAVMAAARAARLGAGLDEVAGEAEAAARRTRIVGMISSLRYFVTGHRLSLPRKHLFLARLGSLARLKLVGTLYEAGRVRGIGMYFREAAALGKLEEYVTGFPDIQEIAVLHARRPEWARSIAARLTAAYPGRPVYVSRLGAVTGMHGGPGSVAVAFIESTRPGPGGIS